MSTRINWSVSVKVSGGPTFGAVEMLEVEAYDPTLVTIPAGGTDVEVDIQPSDTAQVRLLLIRADPGPGAGEELTYSVDGGADDIALDAPQLLTGQGLIGLLGAAPRKLIFTSTMATDTTVQIFVARTAITP